MGTRQQAQVLNAWSVTSYNFEGTLKFSFDVIQLAFSKMKLANHLGSNLFWALLVIGCTGKIT